MFCTLLLPFAGSAKQNIRFDLLSVADGLPGQSVWSVAQDRSGMMWFGTTYGLARYDGYNIEQFRNDPKNSSSLSGNVINALHLDKQGQLWVGTHDQGLNQYNGRNFKRFQYSANSTESLSSNKINAITSSDKGLWIGTSAGLNYLPYGTESITRHTFSNNTADGNVSDNVRSLYLKSSNELIVGTDDAIYSLNLKTKEHRRFQVQGIAQNQKTVFRSIHQDSQGALWVGTNKTLYVFNAITNQFEVFSPVFNNKPILTILSNDMGTWVGTFKYGLYLISNDRKVSHYKYNSDSPNSIAGASVITLFKSRGESIWVGSFSGGVSHFNPSSIAFGLVEKKPNLDCLKSPVINSLYPLPNESILLGTPDGLYRYNNKTETCVRVDNEQRFNSQYNYLGVNFIGSYQKNKLFIGSNIGLSVFNIEKNSLEKGFIDTLNQPTYSVSKVKDDLYLRGTNQGLFEYIPSKNITRPIETSAEVKQTVFHTIKKAENNRFYFATHKGLATLKEDRSIGLVKSDNNSKLTKQINVLYIDKSIWIGGQLNEVLEYDYSGSLLNIYPLADKEQALDILSIQKDQKGYLWVSSTRGLYRVNTLNKKAKLFTKNDGLQSDVFARGSSFKSPDGKLYFGGVNGFNAFHPEDIKDNPVPPKMVLTELRRFNKVVTPESPADDFEGFSIDSPIESLASLEIGHKDYVMSLEFAGLHYADPARNQYAYKLEGLHKDWIETDASNRIVPLTNLNPGEYLFRVKAANKDGVWSLPEDEVALPIIVHPAPWLSWWAYTLYISVFILSLLWFIRYRTQASIKRAAELEVEVAERTKEINTQKKVIESLLERKNELFANISHEFRTPLTLILGPLEKELKALDSPKNPKHLQMIRRNANRLLGMVEQILKLTELKKEETINKVPHAVKPALEAIVESFQPLAESKQIQLTLEPPVRDCTLLASNDALEVMVGNLISNAIKYTQEAGQVKVAASIQGETINIQISDTGVGMSKAQQEEVFERFVRLDKTSDIAGTGIGLSIVKELIKAHQGNVSVSSIEGQGSTFTLSLPITQQQAGANQPLLQAINHLTQVEDKNAEKEATSTSKTSAEQTVSNNNTLLIIDDNRDMQDYICATLESGYHCLTADRGDAGIETAITEIPDLIICDVMMPGIDGYEVARRCREDERTSHIPIVLLTAKGDKESRIQGWNENIDDYMTKPFDEVELKTRINNILSIRNILRRKTGKHFDLIAPDQKDKDKQERNLNAKEQAFIDKLMTAIANNYHDPDFQKDDLAGLMAVSDRQLQRKVRALIDRSPMEILKEYRLKQAASYLANGESVGKAMELCGFNSMSHFSQSFKAVNGISPKQYQQSKS